MCNELEANGLSLNLSTSELQLATTKIPREASARVSKCSLNEPITAHILDFTRSKALVNLMCGELRIDLRVS